MKCVCRLYNTNFNYMNITSFEENVTWTLCLLFSFIILIHPDGTKTVDSGYQEVQQSCVCLLQLVPATCILRIYVLATCNIRFITKKIYCWGMSVTRPVVRLRKHLMSGAEACNFYVDVLFLTVKIFLDAILLDSFVTPTLKDLHSFSDTR